MSHRALQSVLAGLVILGAAGCAGLRGRPAGQESARHTVTPAHVAEPARATIERLTRGGTMHRLGQVEEDGRTIYQVEATVYGREVDYDIAADGTVLASGLRVPYASLPIAVRGVGDLYFDFQTAPMARVKVEGGQTVYEVAGKKGKATAVLKLSETGTIVEER
jgi:hypothetical protein